MRSRRHSGQFCSVISQEITLCDGALGTYQGIVGIIAWLWHEDNRLLTRPVAFEARGA
jgi:hypothetical protein